MARKDNAETRRTRRFAERRRSIRCASVPPLRDPACQTKARKRKPGRSGRDDRKKKEGDVRSIVRAHPLRIHRAKDGAPSSRFEKCRWDD